jgi:hypothetical protein
MEVVRQVKRNRVRMDSGHRKGEHFDDVSAWGIPGVSAAGLASKPGEPLASADGIGPAFEIGGDPVYGSPLRNQYRTEVAFNGTNYLVVWEDERDGTYSDIYGARVGVDGSVLDPAGIVISAASYNQEWPAVASDGIDFLVVWQDERSGSWDIYGARVGADGTLIDPTGIPISSGAELEGWPELAFDGTNYLVVWQDQRNGSWDIYGARVAVDGSVLEPGGVAISTAEHSQLEPVIEFDGTNYLVVWDDVRNESHSDIYCARVGTDGSVLDPGGVAISSAVNDQVWPELAFDGTDYLVVWHDYRSGLWDIYGARVTTAAGVLDTAGIAISTGPNDTGWAAVGFDGADYFVVWGEYLSGSWDVYGARVALDGSVLDTAGIAVSSATNSQDAPAIAFDGANHLVVWQDGRNGSYTDVYGSRVDVDGIVLDPAGIVISTVANDQECPAVAFDGTNYLVVWDDYRNGSGFDIYGSRVGTDGTVLDPGGIPISTADDDQEYSSIAFDGTDYLVVWDDYRSGSSWDIYGARVGVDGNVLDPAGIPISTGPDWEVVSDVAFNGIDYLVVWEDYRSGSNFDIYGSRVGTDGSVLDPAGIAVSTAVGDQECPALAFDGTNYLVVWEDGRSGPQDIYGSRVGTDGSVLDPAGIAMSTAVSGQECPAIAFDGTDYLVVWEDNRSGSYIDIYGTRVAVDGSVLDTAGIAISTIAEYKQNPAVALDGANYVVVWQAIGGGSGGGYDIHGTRVDTYGIVLDPGAVVISADEFNQLYPDVATDAAGALLIVYQSFEAPPIYGSDRIWGNIWQEQVDVREGPISFSSLAHQSYPNPFNPFCTIRYEIPHADRVSLRVFDVTGSFVRTLVDAHREPGSHSEHWDGRAEDGRELPSGVYLYRLEAGEIVVTRKMVLLR